MTREKESPRNSIITLYDLARRDRRSPQSRNCLRPTRRMCIGDAALSERLHAAGLETNIGKEKLLYSEQVAVMVATQ